jgi:ribosome biogenesis GTPase
MQLEELGYNIEIENYRKENNLSQFDIGRVIAEHKERYEVKTINGEFDAEIIGNIRFTASSRTDFPAVGDWVAVSEYDKDKLLIHAILPRKTIIERNAVGKYGETQIIATNIDYAFIVQSVDRDFNINRIERYLTICNTSRVSPIIILTKVDLIDGATLTDITEKIKHRVKHTPIIAISNYTNFGIEKIKETIEKGKTYCLMGSSGVGKSTIINSLSGKEIMHTDSISETSNRGRHITTHRELILLENGGILIDNPGMREVGITDSTNGLETTFDDILRYAKNCKYADCRHTHEAGCAVIEAVENGEIDQASYENYLKMERERNFFETSQADKKRKEKTLGKVIKSYKKDMKRNDL